MLKYQHKIFENSKQISYNIVHKVAISGNASEKWFKFAIFVKKKTPIACLTVQLIKKAWQNEQKVNWFKC